MKMNTLDLARVWAAITGLLLAVTYFGMLYVRANPSPVLAMLVTAIGGFELFLFGQDEWLKRRGKHG
ncbi:hypothetical protein [Novosphingobium sp. 9]|uniref:hypothetical protein n=1 Tax=Novosphingobium sp. 9 TaxID=2025349 RepID=UPI0021B4EAC1|nr:hypothetical protein [Novosphingobium sp. 9]